MRFLTGSAVKFSPAFPVFCLLLSPRVKLYGSVSFLSGQGVKLSRQVKSRKNEGGESVLISIHSGQLAGVTFVHLPCDPEGFASSLFSVSSCSSALDARAQKSTHMFITTGVANYGPLWAAGRSLFRAAAWLFRGTCVLCFECLLTLPGCLSLDTVDSGW